MIVGLGTRVHLFVRPVQHDAIARLFRDVLQCDVRELDFGLPHPIVLVSFPDGTAFSIEFDENAAENACTTWIEFRAHDVAAVQKALREAGITPFRHAGSPHDYFHAPGGQVFRIIHVDYRGP